VSSCLHSVPAYVVVCRGPNCRERGSLPLRKRLTELVRHEPCVDLVGYACFGQCDFGPNVIFYPEDTWYGGLSSPDAAERVVRHAVTGEPLDATPLQPTEVEHREHLANIGELVATLERDRARRQSRSRHWWWPF
jgi:(2Fe-2S) ferredoxin